MTPLTRQIEGASPEERCGAPMNRMSCRDMMHQLRRSVSVENPNQAIAQVGAGSRPSL
ncbi:MAG: hypothetical protein K2K08_07900 [Paramuribaculum sp.]|nr:hypothetical protein [Paramuribaculum sp.]